MDRTKYGRRLTFLNAYFSLAIVLIPLLGTIALLCIMQKFNPIWSIPILHVFLLYVWKCSRQIIELRAGVPVEDKRGWRVPEGSMALLKALLSVLSLIVLLLCLLGLVFIILAESAPQPVSKAELWVMEVMLSVVGIWALLWVGRAAWEWRVYQGRVSPSECVERVEEGICSLPHTEDGMRRYISELTRLVRIGPWLSGFMLCLPLFFLPGYSLNKWLGGAIFTTFVMAGMTTHWKRARTDRDTCQEALKDRLTLSDHRGHRSEAAGSAAPALSANVFRRCWLYGV